MNLLKDIEDLISTARLVLADQVEGKKEQTIERREGGRKAGTRKEGKKKEQTLKQTIGWQREITSIY